jgi:putative glycosyltransferase (TIGR04372 family)
MQEGGWDIFYRKVKKMLKLLSMELVAPLAVRFNIGWIEAHYFVGKKLLLKYKKIASQCNSSMALTINMENIEKKAIACLYKYINHKPDLEGVQDWIEINRVICELFYSKDKYEKRISICQRIENLRRDIAREHQLDSLELEFIPRTFATGNIGPYENMAVYVQAGLLGLRPHRKLILLLDPKRPVNNACYLNYWRQYITIISDPKLIELLSPLEKCLTVPLGLLIPFHQKILIAHRSVGVVREQWIKEKSSSILTLSDEDYKRGWDCLKSLGVPQDAWFVCLHVRESGWNDNGPSENFRNSNINTYSLAIKAVVDAGGWVIRIGDSTMTPLPEMLHVIDYAHSNTKSDWMDVFLCAQCRFFIGTSSGMFGVAMAFGAPLVMTNFLAGQAIYYFSSQDIFIPRICRFREGNRVLSFKQLIAPPVGMFSTQFYYDKFGIEVIENTPEEIRDVAVEMLMRFEGTLKYSDEDESLQERFKTMIKSCSELYGDENVVNARIGKEFLRKHASLLPDMEESLF